MPRHHRVNGLVRLVPAPFRFGLFLVNQNTPAVRNVESFQVPFSHSIEDQRGAKNELLPGDFGTAHPLLKGTIIGRGVVSPVQLE